MRFEFRTLGTVKIRTHLDNDGRKSLCNKKHSFVRLHAATSKETAVLNFIVILRSTSSLETMEIFKRAAVGSSFRCFVFCHRSVTADAQRRGTKFSAVKLTRVTNSSQLCYSNSCPFKQIALKEYQQNPNPKKLLQHNRS